MLPSHSPRNPLAARSMGSLLLLILTCAAVTASAATIDWTGATNTDFATGSNWSGGTAPANDTTTDIAEFTGTLTENQPVVSGSLSVGGLVFGSDGWAISGGTLTFGTSGIDATAVTEGNVTLSSAIRVAASQSWLVGTGGTLIIAGNASSTGTSGSNPVWTLTIGNSSYAGTVVFGSDVASRTLKVYLNVTAGTVDLNSTALTISGLSGTGTVTNSGAQAASLIIDSRNANSTFSGTLSGNLSVTMGDGTDVSTKIQYLNGNNSFTGGLTINSGTVSFGQSASVGTGTITLGNSANTGSSATLYANGTSSSAFSSAITNAIQVVGTGLNTLGVTSYSPTFSGAITLNNSNLTLSSTNNNGSTLTITGGITGIGNVTTYVSGPTASAATSRIVINGASINNTGTLTITSGTKSAGTLAGTVINAVIGANVTDVIQTSADSTLTLTATNLYSGKTDIEAGTLVLGSGSTTATFLPDTTTLYLGSSASLVLNFADNTVMESIAGLYIAGIQQADGTYGAIGSGAEYEISSITGTGMLLVGSAIPEPSTTVALMALVGLVVACVYRRNRL